ncbi:hypothetical protein ScPMuIL_000772 [Solemya velum]
MSYISLIDFFSPEPPTEPKIKHEHFPFPDVGSHGGLCHVGVPKFVREWIWHGIRKGKQWLRSEFFLVRRIR